MARIALRNTFQSRTRLAMSTGGIAVALLLIVAFDGMVAGLFLQLTAYINNVGASVFVAEEGVRCMNSVESQLPLSKASRLRRVPGVAKAEAIVFADSFLTVERGSQIARIIGFDAESGRGGPWLLAAGTAHLKSGEAVIDRVAAANLGVGLGDEVTVLGRDFKVRGLSLDTYNIAGSTAFIRFDDFAALRGPGDVANLFLVWTEDGAAPDAVAQRIKAQVAEVEPVPRAEFAAEEMRSLAESTAEILLAMNGIGFLVGLAAAGLTVYTATRAKLREYGILKALGAGQLRLYALVLEQAFWSVGLSALLAVVLVAVLSQTLVYTAPTLSFLVMPESLLRMLVAAVATAVVAAVLPVVQVARVDPAVVFRR